MDGGYPDLLVMNPRVANDLRGLLDNSSFMRLGQDDNRSRPERPSSGSSPSTASWNW